MDLFHTLFKIEWVRVLSAESWRNNFKSDNIFWLKKSNHLADIFEKRRQMIVLKYFCEVFFVDGSKRFISTAKK